MKKVIIMLLIVTVPSFVYALDCDKTEDAQIKDMDRTQMEKAFCSNVRTYRMNLHMLARGYDVEADRDKAACFALLEKFESAYKSKFKEALTIKKCRGGQVR